MIFFESRQVVTLNLTKLVALTLVFWVVVGLCKVSQRGLHVGVARFLTPDVVDSLACGRSSFLIHKRAPPCLTSPAPSLLHPQIS